MRDQPWLISSIQWNTSFKCYCIRVAAPGFWAGLSLSLFSFSSFPSLYVAVYRIFLLEFHPKHREYNSPCILFSEQFNEIIGIRKLLILFSATLISLPLFILDLLSVIIIKRALFLVFFVVVQWNIIYKGKYPYLSIIYKI